MGQEAERAAAAPDYRAVFDAAPGLYLLLDRALTIRDANSAYCRATLTEAGAIIGRPLFEVFPDNPDDPNADGVRNLRASLERVLALRRADTMAIQKYDIRTPDGDFEERHWSPINTPVLDGAGEVCLIVHRVEDVTELVRLKRESRELDQIARDQRRTIAELSRANRALDESLKTNARLRANRDFLASIVESSNDAIVSRSLGGRIASWNAAAAAMFGYSAEEALGQSTAILAPPELSGEADLIFRRLQAGDPVTRYETTRRHRDGTPIAVSLTVSKIVDHDGAVVGTSAIMRDVTESKRAEENLRNLQAELIHLSRWNTMGMMASTLAHELNQPLTAAMNYTRAAKRFMTDPAARERAEKCLDSTVEEIKLAGGIIRSLRDFIDRRESGRKPEAVNGVVEEAFALSMAGGSCEAGLDLAGALPPVPMDRVQIQQVLLNLIRNATDAMQGMAAPRLVLRTAPGQDGQVQITVEDWGPGLDPDVAARLFQPFVTAKQKGMGIGLTICQSIVQSHGGRIWTEPRRSGGTLFHVALPPHHGAAP